MSFERVHRSGSQSPQFSSSTSQFAPRPFPVQEPKRPPTQEDIENEAFQQNKFETFGLRLKEQHGTITPIEQERLGMLQAKMDSFWAQRMERAKAQPNLLEILVRNAQASPTSEPALPVQPTLAIAEPDDQYEQGVQPPQADRTSAVALRIQRTTSRPTVPAPSPPDWLGSWKSSAVHVKRDIWSVKLPSLGGDTWVGPYDQLSAYIKKQGFAGKMEAAHIVGGEHLQDIKSAFSYEKGPCVAVDKSLHATWTKQTTDLQKGTMGGRATKKWDRAIVTTEDVIELYDELYRSHPELRKMSRNIVKGQGVPRSVRVTSSGTRSAPETRLATGAQTGASLEPGEEADSKFEPRRSAGTGSTATSTEVLKGRVRASIEPDKASSKGAIKFQTINISDYPPDKRGPITRFFTDRPVLAKLSVAGASLSTQYLKGKAFEHIQEHFDSAIHNARQEFEQTFPDRSSLFAKMGVTQTHKVYQTALAALKARNFKRDLPLIAAAFSPPERIEEAIHTAKRLGSTHKVRGNDIQNFLMASDAYMEAMDSVENTVYEHLKTQPGLPAIAQDLFARAAVLRSLSTDLAELVGEMVPLALFPGAGDAILDIYWAAGIFATLAYRLGEFGSEVEQRHQEYRHLINELNRELGKVSYEVLRWN